MKPVSAVERRDALSSSDSSEEEGESFDSIFH